MGKCEFVAEKNPSVRGFTLFAEGGNACTKETAVYLRPDHNFGAAKVNVVLWLHGFYVRTVRTIFDPPEDQDMTLRQNLIGSKKDVVLIAPWLGYKYIEKVDGVDKAKGSLGLGDLANAKGVELYLDEVLAALARFRSAHLQRGAGGANATGSAPTGGAAPRLELGNLAIAGHSAGGAMMRQAVAALGDRRSNLKECWGLDCLYDDDWPAWVRDASLANVQLYFYFARGIRGERVAKLWKSAYGTLKHPLPGGRPRNLHMTPALQALGTLIDRTAFLQTSEDIQKKTALDDYERIRKAADPLLDRPTATEYWNMIHKNAKGHFEVVRDVFGPRIKQSPAL